MQGPNDRSLRTDLDAAYTLLGESRRRYLLYQMRDVDYVRAEDLALQIAAWEEGETVKTVSEAARQSVYVSLVHNHLPRLADHDVVEYDRRSGDVVKSDGFEDLEPLLEQFEPTEDVSSESLSAPFGNR